jgi:hypothetical protein
MQSAVGLGARLEVGWAAQWGAKKGCWWVPQLGVEMEVGLVRKRARVKAKEKVARLAQKLVQEMEGGKEGWLEPRTAKSLVEKWAQV